jgi:hypothetical protein
VRDDAVNRHFHGHQAKFGRRSLFMPTFSPCRVSQDDGIHLSATASANRTLCDQPLASPEPVAGDLPVCPQCAKALLRHIFSESAGREVVSIEVLVHSAT